MRKFCVKHRMGIAIASLLLTAAYGVGVLLLGVSGVAIGIGYLVLIGSIHMMLRINA